jgi:hypothetical protein
MALLGLEGALKHYYYYYYYYYEFDRLSTSDSRIKFHVSLQSHTQPAVGSQATPKSCLWDDPKLRLRLIPYI